jgi:transposase
MKSNLVGCSTADLKPIHDSRAGMTTVYEHQGSSVFFGLWLGACTPVHGMSRRHQYRILNTSGRRNLLRREALEARVRRDHPLRSIRIIVNEALSVLEREFAALYSPIGRPSIPPEKLLRAMLLQAFYSIRSERLLMERLEYDLLFRWFVGIGVDDVAWDHSVFSKNRDRLLEGDIAAKFLAAVLAQPKVKKLLSSDHFSVDGA